MRIVSFALNLSFLEASCCKVDVVNGAYGLRLVSLAEIVSTLKLLVANIPSTADVASSSFRIENFSIFSLLSFISFDLISVSGASSLEKIALIDQYSSGVNFEIEKIERIFDSKNTNMNKN